MYKHRKHRTPIHAHRATTKNDPASEPDARHNRAMTAFRRLLGRATTFIRGRTRSLGRTSPVLRATRVRYLRDRKRISAAFREGVQLAREGHLIEAFGHVRHALFPQELVVKPPKVARKRSETERTTSLNP